MILIDLLRKFLPPLLRSLVREVKQSGFFGTEVTDDPLAGPKRKLHAVSRRITREGEQAIVLCSGEQLGEPVNGGFAHVRGVPGIVDALGIDIAWSFQFSEN